MRRLLFSSFAHFVVSVAARLGDLGSPGEGAFYMTVLFWSLLCSIGTLRVGDVIVDDVAVEAYAADFGSPLLVTTKEVLRQCQLIGGYIGKEHS